MGIFRKREDSRAVVSALAAAFQDQIDRLWPRRPRAYNGINSTTVIKCINDIAQDVAKLPLHLYKRNPDGSKSRDFSNPLYNVFRLKPNKINTIDVFLETLVKDLIITGQAFIARGSTTGKTNSLWRISPSAVTVKWADGVKSYGIAGETFYDGDIIHILGNTEDGINGKSVLQLVRSLVDNEKALADFSADYFANGCQVGAIIEVPSGKELTEDAEKRLKAEFRNEYAGKGTNRGGLALLKNGLTFKPVEVKAADAQLVEQRRAAAEEIATILRVPLNKIRSGANTYNSVEAEQRDYVTTTLSYYTTKICNAINSELFGTTAQSFVEFSFDILLQGLTKERYEAYQIAINNALMTPNEARAKENLPPIPGGDFLLVPLNMAVLKDGKIINNTQAPAASGGTK